MGVTSDINDPNLNDHYEDGQQKSHLVLKEEKLYGIKIPPGRDKYVHNRCGVATIVPADIAKTYIVNPQFYNVTW